MVVGRLDRAGPARVRLVGRVGEQAVTWTRDLELTPRGFSKRGAIESFMRMAPFAGRTPVFIGDDVTDEDGFEAVNALGGYSVRVGDLAATAARFRFSSVTTVIAWLRERNLNRHIKAQVRRKGSRPW